VLLGFIVIGTQAFSVGNLEGQTHFNSLVSRSTGVFFLLLWAVGVAGQLNVFLQTGIGIPFVCKSGSMAATGLFMIGVIIGCEASATRQTLQPEEPQPEVNQLLA
jgi:cell division protein FtsW (lipid II flippase)